MSAHTKEMTPAELRARWAELLTEADRVGEMDYPEAEADMNKLCDQADLCDALADAKEREAKLREAALALANAADDVGVRFFDTDTMEPEVEAMQAATLAVRKVAGEASTPTADPRAQAFEECAQKARDWAAHYSPGSDGRNTFVLLAEWAEQRAATPPEGDAPTAAPVECPICEKPNFFSRCSGCGFGSDSWDAAADKPTC